VTRRSVVVVAGVAAVAIAALAAIAFGLIGLGRVGPGGALGAPHFVEEAAAAGIDQVYAGTGNFPVGGGLAVFDCNADGKPDLYVAGGAGPAAIYRNDSLVGGALRFSRVASPVTDLSNVIGAYPIDINGDGIVDLAVLRFGESVLLKGLGNCAFERANEAWGFAGGNAWTMAFSATWEGSAAFPTLALGHYLGVDPNSSDCDQNQLIRPNPAGTGFGSPLALDPGYCALSMLFSDWNRSGHQDLRISNDRNYYVDGDEQLWQVPAGQPPRLYSSADGWVNMQIFGMGIASYDVTGDGYPDLFLTSQADNKLQTLTAGPGQPTYGDIALKRGVTAARPFTGGDVLPSTAWHPEFQDVNNDGLIDLFVSKGNINGEAGFAEKDPSDLFLGQPDGTFVEGADAAGIVSFERGRGAALVDFNLDGLLDLVQVNFGTTLKLWRNVGSGSAAAPAPMGNWLALQVNQPGPNHDAIGGWLDVKAGDATMERELTIGGGHASGQLGWIHFGIGAATQVQVQVHWPGGETGPWISVPANTFQMIERGAATAQPWLPAAN
jgi:enediyne biosynthesis protein E4